MRLVNTTNSNSELIKEQLENTDAHLVETYSLGNTTVIYTQARTHDNLIVLNKKRAVRDTEIDFVVQHLFKTTCNDPKIEVIHCDYFIEISLDK
ncbi:DUF1827 family protein [Carnobacteriaceae bacterium zg-ZUI252]|nr:DUF1827 family protein [Carnobacteriaceae bacterium zg-ZUI252]MBS4770133.1 DUF1827 family protein [Carnobacteriaceae bacterium zg-ZUI240]QTU82916.1 DUF1827 family protein [Carnobacteriaceae bacterium zg-C25]